MPPTNNGRPLPWHDTALCDRPLCGGPMVPVGPPPHRYVASGARIYCAACGKGRRGTQADVAKSVRAALAYRQLEDGLVYPDRGCQRCNSALPLDRDSLCVGCVDLDLDERQASLFPGVA